MKRKTVLSLSPEQTRSIGERCSFYLQAGDCIPLIGELGSGKTCFAQGVAKGLGVPPHTPVNSPSFTLVNHYDARIPLYHVDLYRLESERELDDLEMNDIIFGDGITLIEWPQLILPKLHSVPLTVDFFWDMTAETTRILTFSSVEKRFNSFFLELP
ncbi:MAG: tRNA (adenosine(37)-N6)-threonylcarbamoyltransferase complex ATPase subunit type 1 TsaE [bacterium]